MAAAKPRVTPRGRRQAELYRYFTETYVRHADRDYYDTPFVLDEWQWRDIYRPVFGTLRKDGTRVYRQALIGLKRYTGKSEIASAIVITVMMMEPVPNGEYGVIASSEKQAAIVFQKISAMIRLDPYLSTVFEVMKKEIRHRETGATLATYPADEAAIQGHHFVCAVGDEAHVWKSTALYSAIVSGMKDKNSLFIVITTASAKRRGVLWDYIIPTMMKNPDAYVCWKGAQTLDEMLEDEPFDPSDRRLWRKCCYASWHTMEQMDEQFRSVPLADFLRYELNVFPPDDLGADAAFSKPRVRRCLSKGGFPWQMPIAVGIDAANSGDAFAVVAAAQDPETSAVTHLYPMVFESEDGAFHDFEQIESVIADWWESYDVRRVSCDPARMLLMSQHLMNRWGVPVESYAQNNANMAAASAYLSSLVDDGRLFVHGPQREEWARHMSAAVRADAASFGWRMGKTGDRKHIDAAVASAIAAIVLDANERGESWGMLSL